MTDPEEETPDSEEDPRKSILPGDESKDHPDRSGDWPVVVLNIVATHE